MEKPIRGKNVRWSNIATFKKDMEATEYTSPANSTGNKVNKKIVLVEKVSQRPLIVITLGDQSVMLVR